MQRAGYLCHPLFRAGLLALTCFIAALISIELSRQPGSIAALWLPNALALGVLLRQPRGLWGLDLMGVFAAIVVVNALQGDALLQVLGLSMANVLEILIAFLLLRRTPKPVRLENVARLLEVLMIAALVAPTIGASLGAAIVHLTSGTPFWAVWESWWAGDAMGMITLLPLLLVYSPEQLRCTLSGNELREFILLLALCLLAGVMSLIYLRYPFIVITLPLMLAAMRTSLFTTALLGVVTVAVLVVLGISDYPPLLPGGEGFFRDSLHLAAALSLALPLTINVLLEGLRDSEQQFRQAMDCSAIGMALVSLEGKWIRVNPALCEMLGYREAELLALTFQDLTHPDDLEAGVGLVGQAIAGEVNNYRIEKRYIRKDGRVIWVLLVVSLVRDQTGRPRYFIAQIENIDERKQSEIQLQHLTQRLELAVEAGRVAIWEWNLNQNTLAWDDLMHRLHDQDEGSFNRRYEGWVDSIYPADQPHIEQALREVLEGAETFEAEYRVRRSTGGIRHLRTLGRVVVHPPDESRLIIGTTWDITEQRQMTDRLFEEKERLAITLHSIGDAVICTDAATQVTYLNPTAEAMTGWSQVEARGLPLSAIFHIIDERTDKPIANPVERCLNELITQYLREDTVLINRTGQRLNIQESAAPVLTASGDVHGAVLVFQDVTKARNLQKKLAYSASHDALTGLPNRVQFEELLRETCRQMHQQSAPQTLCFIDLDRFKIVNDTAGHAAGDALLQEVARLLKAQVRSHDVLARLGGDEFGLLLLDCAPQRAESIAQTLVDAVAALRFTWEGRVYEIGASVGLTVIQPDNNFSLSDLMTQADVACYAAKAGGRNRVSVYHPNRSDAHRHHSEIQMAAGLREALEGKRFRLYAQEVRALKAESDLQAHYELLIRLHDPQGAVLSPGAFIPAAERYDLMACVDRWVITTALEEYGPAIADAEKAGLSISLNLSANSLNDPQFPAFVQETLHRSVVSSQRIHFEITETALINNVSSARAVIETLRAAGCRIALDDFGTGLSSFGYLKQFPVDYLKIDGSFIRQIKLNRVDRAIVESLHDIAHKLGIKTIAEYVESEETRDLLREIGLDYIQGYSIHRPQPFDEVLRSCLRRAQCLEPKAVKTCA